jgi:hypothetical protein
MFTYELDAPHDTTSPDERHRFSLERELKLLQKNGTLHLNKQEHQQCLTRLKKK